MARTYVIDQLLRAMQRGYRAGTIIRHPYKAVFQMNIIGDVRRPMLKASSNETVNGQTTSPCHAGFFILVVDGLVTRGADSIWVIKLLGLSRQLWQRHAA